MFPLKTIATGVLLLLIGAAGFIYIVARPKPDIESLQPEALPVEETQPSPTGSTSGKTPVERPDTVVTTETRSSMRPASVNSQMPQIKTFSVKLLSPVMAQTFTAPATVRFRATANPDNNLKTIEFYLAPDGRSVCQSLTTPNTSVHQKIGEVTSAPYEFVWHNVARGIYNVMAVATYETGEQQISDPTVIIVNAAQDHESTDWKGWKPSYDLKKHPQQDASLMPLPTPTPSQASCPAITISSSSPSIPVGRPVTFRANVAGGELPPDLQYKWSVSGGEIVSGQDTAILTVATSGLMQKKVIASLEVSHLNTICADVAYDSVTVVQPRWLTRDAIGVLTLLKDSLGSLAREMTKQTGTRLYILANDGPSECLDEESVESAKLAKKYLVDLYGMDSSRILLRNGNQERPGPDFVIVPTGEPPPHSIALFVCRQNGASIKTAGFSPKVPLNRKCPDLEENIAYDTVLQASSNGVNTCPYNPRDPSNDSTQVILSTKLASGNYGSFPLVDYWTNGGNITSAGAEAIWDLSRLKLRPGTYTAIAKSDDSCDCASVNTANVNVTNFCTPCLTLKRKCTSAVVDGSQTFVAETKDFAMTRSKEGTTLHWSTTAGAIVRGQGTGEVVIDTSNLAETTQFIVTVSAEGLQRYCVNKLEIAAVAGQRCDRETGKTTFLPLDSTGSSRRAKRQNNPGVEAAPPVVTSAGPVDHETNGETTTPDLGKPTGKEKEWMKVSWSPRVKTDESFNITVTYNRTTDTVEISDKAGQVSEQLKPSGAFKLFKDKYGPDYEVLADVKLSTAGLDCQTCNQEQYQSLDEEKVDWNWPVSPSKKGTQVFNLELWVKGEPRIKQSGKDPIPARKVWERPNLKVQVTEHVLTRNTVFAGGGLCAVLGLGLCVRGLKIYRVGDTYNVGQAVAVGRSVTMNNTTVNQQKPTSNEQTGDKKDA